jgi:nitrogen fixation/metabolism regulation signal transduction histidine kinase
MSIGVVVFIIEFIRYIEKFKNHFLYFLNAIDQEDFSVSFKKGHSEYKDDRLTEILNELTDKFRKLRVEKESRHQYLKTVIDHINIGLISYNEKGEITLLNKAARDFLQKPHLKMIDSLKSVDQNLYDEIINLSTQKKAVIKLIRGKRLFHISLQATEIKHEDGFEKVISMQDIKNELDEKELDSWHKLVRVINHEIMNSVIPITTLANVLDGMISTPIKKSTLDLNEIAEGIRTIEHRSKGLADFVRATKSLTNIGQPVFREIPINELFPRVQKLIDPLVDQMGIHLQFKQGAENISLKADLELIEQVLINLLKNAIESFEDPTHTENIIRVTAESRVDQNVITVHDNGKGIDEKELENIFIPFYTTKKEGSGIGLPLSRQIMRLHKGSISVQSEVGSGTRIELVF